ncbi:unnamed protein product [marine sediment metagenome]|uniref:Ada DNA repair metal-binding domain-containing protein n=1 Tax=marine sediment metagenome TaxID=412755 RepID=X0SAM7_9ZZZZ
MSKTNNFDLYSNRIEKRKNSAAVKTKIEGIPKKEYLVYGDSLSYEIILKNTGDHISNYSFNLFIIDPNEKKIFERTYKNISLAYGEKYVLCMNISPGYLDKIPLRTSGNYEIRLETFPGFEFREFTEYASKKFLTISRSYRIARYGGTYGYYFDVMPKWEYDVFQENKKIANTMIGLTLVIAVLTIMQLYLILEKYLERKKKPKYFATKKGGKVHKSLCPHIKGKNNLISFKSLEEARRKNLSPCSKCI